MSRGRTAADPGNIMRKLSTAAAVWVLGCLTLVPWCVWRLCTSATRDDLALLIMLPVGWLFFYWPIVGPLLAALKVRRMMRLLDDPDRLLAQLRALEDGAGREAAVAFLARENGLPRFAVRWLARRLEPHIKALLAARGTDPDGERPVSPAKDPGSRACTQDAAR